MVGEAFSGVDLFNQSAFILLNQVQLKVLRIRQHVNVRIRKNVIVEKKNTWINLFQDENKCEDSRKDTLKQIHEEQPHCVSLLQLNVDDLKGFENPHLLNPCKRVPLTFTEVRVAAHSSRCKAHKYKHTHSSHARLSLSLP